MDKIALAKKALESVHGMSFNCMVGSYEGGACGDGYSDYYDLELSREQVLYLIHCPQWDEVFAGLEMEPAEVEDTLNKMAYEMSWPDGGPRAYVKECIPDELKELSERLNNLDADDAKAVEEIRSQLKAIQDGEFTFRFDIYGGGYDYCFAENVEESLKLTGDEARALLYCEHHIAKVFKGICSEGLGEDFINIKAEEADFADNYDHFSYTYHCDELDNFIDGWQTIMSKILSGDIDESSLGRWLKYFDDEDNFEESIDSWEEYYEDEEEEDSDDPGDNEND